MLLCSLCFWWGRCSNTGMVSPRKSVRPGPIPPAYTNRLMGSVFFPNSIPDPLEMFCCATMIPHPLRLIWMYNGPEPGQGTAPLLSETSEQLKIRNTVLQKEVRKYAVVELGSQSLRHYDTCSKPRADLSASTNVQVLMASFFFKYNQLGRCTGFL